MFLLRLIWAVVRGVSTRRADLVAENLALRQQLIVLHRKTKRLAGKGPHLLALARSILERMARQPPRRQADDCRALAPAGIQVLLGVEESTQGWPSGRGPRGPRKHGTSVSNP